jgi:hypothetical protein
MVPARAIVHPNLRLNRARFPQIFVMALTPQALR